MERLCQASSSCVQLHSQWNNWVHTHWCLGSPHTFLSTQSSLSDMMVPYVLFTEIFSYFVGSSYCRLQFTPWYQSSLKTEYPSAVPYAYNLQWLRWGFTTGDNTFRTGSISSQVSQRGSSGSRSIISQRCSRMLFSRTNCDHWFLARLFQWALMCGEYITACGGLFTWVLRTCSTPWAKPAWTRHTSGATPRELIGSLHWSTQPSVYWCSKHERCQRICPLWNIFWAT